MGSSVSYNRIPMIIYHALFFLLANSTCCCVCVLPGIFLSYAMVPLEDFDRPFLIGALEWKPYTPPIELVLR